ncbi:S8 family serine peptidase [Glycomyces sp. NRRL B-16210]|uniref:S8 family peptidase n=1 Tax=Glycomyces sp. NRRL B-16210 TaxID=1463821 RepID=UPI0004BEF9D1|nr:S8 family serine peptidase [Glycomyces sp. NRRL B-16210]
MTVSHHTTRRLAVATLAGVATVGAITLGGIAAQAEPLGQVLGADSATAIPGSYLVVMADDLSTAAAENVTEQYGGEVVESFDTLNGHLAELSANEAARLAADDAVAFVEQNQIVTVDDVQTGATWGLDRVDQLDLPLDGNYEYLGDGSGVTAYIVDTGILASHSEFTGRVGAGYDFVDGDSDPTDCNGHGTHVAGTVGGTTYGLAKQVTLVGVRVLDCSGSGTYAGVIAGIDWVAANASGPSVANMSLGGDYSAAVNSAVDNAVLSGVTFAVAAGNEDTDACIKSPASSGEAITVGASDNTDTRAYFSNYGSCVDVFAPGVGITSAWHTSPTATNTISGTSMASPHVAGAVAVYLSLNPGATTAEVKAWVIGNAGEGRLSDVQGSPNLLLYTGTEDGGGTPGEPADCAGSNGTAQFIADRATVESTITLDCEGAASNASKVSVNISHTYRGDLAIYLIAPDGSSYQVKSSGADAADNVIATYTVNLSSETKAGAWTLRVVDNYAGDTGTLNTWSLEV